MFEMTQKRIEHTSIHEAGHCVLNLAVGGSLTHVEVFCETSTLADLTMGIAGCGLGDMGAAERIAVLLGGEAATHVLLGDAQFERLRDEAVAHVGGVREVSVDSVSEYMRWCVGRTLDFTDALPLDQDPEDIEGDLEELITLEGTDTVRAMRVALAEHQPVKLRTKSGRKRSRRTLSSAELARAKLAEKRILSDWERVTQYLAEPKPRAAVGRIARELAQKGKLSGARVKKVAGVLPRFKAQALTPWWCAA